MVPGASGATGASGSVFTGRIRPQMTLWSLLLLGFSACALYFGWFTTVDRFLYDSLLPISAPEVDDRVMIVGVDERTLDVVGRWPWPRAEQARLINRLLAAEPASLTVDIVYSGTSDIAQDRALAESLNSPAVTALPMIIDSVALHQPLIEVLPFPELLPLVDVLGHVHIELDDDSIARSTYLYQGVGNAHWSHLALALAEHLAWLPEPVVRPEECTNSAGFTLQNHRCDQVLVPFSGPPGTILEISALDILEGRVAAEQLRGRALFLGLTASGVADSVTTPVSGESRPMSGVEYNANLFNAIINGRTIRPAPSWLVWVITMLCAVALVILLPQTSPKSMLAVSVAGAAIPLLITGVGLLLFARYIPLGVASMVALLAYPLWSWRRHETAWRYLDGEMMRLQLERERYEPVEAALVASRSLQPERLALLLDAKLNLEAPRSPSELPDVAGPALMAWSDPSGERHRLTRSREFTAAEQALVGELFAADRSDDNRPEPIPGESLAAKIRLLRQQALAVQLGRDIGLQGLERMASGVCVISAVGDLLFANSALQQYLDGNLTPGQDIFRLLGEIPLPLGRSWVDIWRSVVCQQQNFRFETQLNEATQVFIFCTPLTGDAQGAWLLTITDTTEVREAQRRREEALAFLSHDLRSPILSVIALARKPVADLNDSAELLGEVEAYAQKSLAVSEQFLQLSRLEAQTQFETYELDVLSVLSNAIDQSYTLARTQEVNLNTDSLSEYDDGIWVRGNGELLERAFANLLANAVKYSNANSTVTVRAQRLVTDGAVQIDIQDQGLGIPENDLEHIFEPYYRSAEPALAERRGSGLGLRFVKTVVERHEGSIEVSSQLGAGSCFRLKLPLLADVESLPVT